MGTTQKDCGFGYMLTIDTVFCSIHERPFHECALQQQTAALTARAEQAERERDEARSQALLAEGRIAELTRENERFQAILVRVPKYLCHKRNLCVFGAECRCGLEQLRSDVDKAVEIR